MKTWCWSHECYILQLVTREGDLSTCVSTETGLRPGDIVVEREAVMYFFYNTSIILHVVSNNCKKLYILLDLSLNITNSNLWQKNFHSAVKKKKKVI